MPRRAGRAIHHRGGPDRRTGPPGRTTRHPSRRTALRQRTRISLCRNDRLGERSYRPALHPARRPLAQRLRRVLQLPSARRMPQHQHLLVPDPGPSRHRRLEIRLQQPPPTLSPGIPTPRPLRCHLYPPMNDSHPSWTNSRGPAIDTAYSTMALGVSPPPLQCCGPRCGVASVATVSRGIRTGYDWRTTLPGVPPSARLCSAAGPSNGGYVAAVRFQHYGCQLASSPGPVAAGDRHRLGHVDGVVRPEPRPDLPRKAEPYRAAVPAYQPHSPCCIELSVRRIELTTARLPDRP